MNADVEPARPLRIGSRRSLLARTQAESVMASLQSVMPHRALAWQGVQTQGDQALDRPLAELARASLEKGVFVRELEVALRQGDIDVAVHSLKDMPGDRPSDLAMRSAGEREDPRDALVSHVADSLDALPAGARVGTSSVRRAAMLARLRPDLRLLPVRGNLQTRLAKLDAGEFEALILAAAGLRRLNEAARIAQVFDPVTQLTPACGQGILAVECRAQDADVLAALNRLALPAVEAAMTAERAALNVFQAGCSAPLGVYAAPQADGNFLLRLWFLPDGARDPLTAQARFDPQQAAAAGVALAEGLLAAESQRL